MYCYNAFYRADPDRAKALFADETVPGLDAIRLDLKTRSAYYKQFEGKAEEIGNRVNDAYLKAFSQTGLRSYGEVVDYLIAWHHARDRSPFRGRGDRPGAVLHARVRDRTGPRGARAVDP